MRMQATVGLAVFLTVGGAQQPLRLTRAQYEDRVQAAWSGQIIATLMGFPFEHRTASTQWVDRFPKKYDTAPVDDDYYYELVALRGFEKYGLDMTLDQLGEQWQENSAGAWGSGEQTRLPLARGLKGSETGHPRYNKLWFTIGPQFSADIYGLLAPGDPNLAGRLARKYGRIKWHAAAGEGGGFIAGTVRRARRNTALKPVGREAARLIDQSSPYRQCLDLVISMAQAGKPPEEIFEAVEGRWHMEYPATNNAVANG